MNWGYQSHQLSNRENILSAQLTQLLRRLWQLRRKYLPVQASPTGDYSIDEIESMGVFRLLASAELESYLENLAERTLQAMKARRNAGAITKANATLLAVQKVISIPGNTDDIKETSFLFRAYEDSEAAHARNIAANKGASSHNFLGLLVPIGLDETQVDEQFLRNLGLLAVKRGEFAHNATHLVQNIPNPIEDQALVLDIARGLKDIEQQMADALL